MEFSQLKQEYKFLEEILYLFDILDQPVDENDQNKEFLSNCNDVHILKGDTTGKYVNFCKKLLKNMLLLSDRNYRDQKFNKYCDILYMWLYFEINKNSIPYNIAQPLFNASERMITSKLSNKTPCPYFMFKENIQEPRKLMNLRIFNNNVKTIQGLLKNRDKLKDCYLKKYVYECVKIYKEINSTYTSSGDCNSSPQKNACEIITRFNSLYRTHILNIQGITHKFPELSSDTPLNLHDICQLDERESNSFPEETQAGTPMTQGVSTALSSLIGIPPFLVLIYKFTPVRNLFRFRNKKHTIITSDFDKNMENELFHAIKDDSNIKDIQSKYNIGYEPI